MTTTSPFQLLELNVISAQDLAKTSRSMKTYAMASVHPDRKLTTRVDANGGTSPTWNDKFVFRVDNAFLQSENSAITMEIYALNWFRDVHVGTVRVLVGNLIPPHNRNIGMRFVALQVRRPSGRPQGILNVGVTILDGTMRSMPLYTQLSASAVGYQKFMGQEDPTTLKGSMLTNEQTRAQLGRSRSDKSSFLGMEASSSLLDENARFYLPKPNGSVVIGDDIKGKSKKGKVIYDKPLSIVDASAPSDLSLAVKLKAQQGKTDSVLSYSGKQVKKKGSTAVSQSEIGIPPISQKIGNKKAGSEIAYKTQRKKENENNSVSIVGSVRPPPPPPGYKYNRGYPMAKDFASGSVWSESEVGPSPSEVAAAIAEDSKYRQFDEGRSSMLDDKWSIQDSEGVKTKLERWRMQQIPATYGYSGTTSDTSSMNFRRRGRKNQRKPALGGKFSCFGNFCGYQCSIVCGADNNIVGPKYKRVGRPPSLDSVSTYI